MKRFFTALVTGLVVGGVGGFLLGVYALPIIVEWRHGVQERAEAPEADEHDPAGAFDRNSPGSDPLHWGEGRIRVSEGSLVFEEDVRLAPGPDYRVYLSKSFAQTKEEFLAIKPGAVEIASLEVFSGPLSFPIPPEVDPDVYDNVVVWCEAFAMYIASARLE
ncbi:MAG: DM13 domain-containing protein [Gammaproteobacteria bacterium]|nr:DM13 domain-containing protein [Gammaproteobacteria bacterium]